MEIKTKFAYDQLVKYEGGECGRIAVINILIHGGNSTVTYLVTADGTDALYPYTEDELADGEG